MAQFNLPSFLKMGPYLPSSYYENKIKNYNKLILKYVNECMELKKYPFYRLKHYEFIGKRLLDLNLRINDLKHDYDLAMKLDNLYKMEAEYSKCEYFVSEHYKSDPFKKRWFKVKPNYYHLLREREVKLTAASKYSSKCVHCMNILVRCDCDGYPMEDIPKIKIEKIYKYSDDDLWWKFVDQLYPRHNFWGDTHKFNFADFENYRVIDKSVELKYKFLLKNFKLLRSTSEVRFYNFALYTQIYERIRTEKNVYKLSNLLLNYMLSEYVIKEAEEEIDEVAQEVKETDNIRFIRGDSGDLSVHYRKMEEDQTKFVFDTENIVMARVSSIIENQMEAAHETGDIKIEQSANVILTTHAEESVAEPINIGTDNWQNLCSSQNVSKYTELMERWQRFGEFEWTVNDNSIFKPLKTYVLPRDFVLSNANSPNNLMFKMYTYFRSDMEIKFVINSNKFHCGQLQASFYYGDTMDKHAKDRQNVYSASQMTHCLLDAAAANDGILKIPYRHYKPLMATTIRGDDNLILDMGTLRIFVLNKLRLPVGDTSTVTITMFYRYINPTFHGMKPQDMGKVQAQMFGLNNIKTIVNATANLVNQTFPDSQRDNPTNIIPPKSVVPWSSHSWCIGDQLPESSNVLRLIATGNTPHPPGTLPSEPEMDINYIIRIYGLVKRVNWNMSDGVGKVLVKIPFTPNWNVHSYPSIFVSNEEAYECNILPPLAIMANMFAYWRGSIEYKMDFISTQFHTGRLMIAYLPREVLDKDPTIEQLSHCDHLIFDLRENNQINYINSFLSDKPWWPRRSRSATSTEVFPPGNIYILVLNKLTAPQNISPEITFNIYTRAGIDFELHVPVNSTLGLSYNTNLIKSQSSLKSYLYNYGPPYTSMYIGAWVGVNGGLILRYGPTVGHVTQFQPLKTYTLIYELVSPAISLDHTEFKNCKYLVIFPNKDNSFAYGGVFSGKAAAQEFLSSIMYNGTEWVCDYSKLMHSAKVDGEYLNKNVRYWWSPIQLDDFVIIANGNEERNAMDGPSIDIQSTIRSTGGGMLTFGEKIYNIKQLLRRYAPYGNFKINSRTRQNRSTADFAVPVMPQGLEFKIKDKDDKELKYANMIRDGPLAILASGYRFFRGSIRFRFIINSVRDGTFWIQHRPEEALTSSTIFVPNTIFRDGTYQPGYATLIQTTRINEIVEVEIPFYLPGQFGMLQRPDLGKIEDAVHYSMGTLYCGFDSIQGGPNDVEYSVEIFYSMGDDMIFTVFQGFPPVFDLGIFNNYVIAQGNEIHDDQQPCTSATALKNEQVVVKNNNNIFKKGLDKVKNYVDEGIQNRARSVIAETVTDIKKQITKDHLDVSPAGDLIPKGSETIAPETNRDIATIVKSLMGDITAEKQQVMIALISNLVHCVINPSFKQIAWAIASVFMQIGLLAYSYLEKFVNVLKKFLCSFDRLCRGAKKSEKAPDAVIPNSSDDDTDVEAAFVSTCVTGMLALVGATDKPLPNSLPNFAQYLYHGLPKFSMTANGLFRFLKNNLYMFKKIYYWIMSKINKKYIYYTELANCKEDVKKFILSVQWCLDSANEAAIYHDPQAILRVYELANTAQSYLAKKALSNVANRLYLFEKYCQDIISLRNKLVRQMISPEIRFEPFVFAMVGDSNVGKSHMVHDIHKNLMQSINYKTYGGLVHTVAPGNDFWNNLECQPCCHFDDFLCITSPEYALKQIGELFALKSKAVFNPPMAAVEQKNIRYNPLVVSLCMNKAFPHQSGLMLDSGVAWRRRRDFMVHVTKKPEFKGVDPRRMCTKDQLAFSHLYFQIYNNPSGGENGEDTGFSETKLSYAELLPIMIRRFHEFFDEECIQYDRAIQEARKFYPDPELTKDDYLKSWSTKLKQINRSRISDEDWNEIQRHITSLHAEKITPMINEVVNSHLMEKKVKVAVKSDVIGIQVADTNNEVVPNAGEGVEIPVDSISSRYTDCNAVTYIETKNKFVRFITDNCKDFKLRCFCIDAFIFAEQYYEPDLRLDPLLDGVVCGRMGYSYPCKRPFSNDTTFLVDLKDCGINGCIYQYPEVMYRVYKMCVLTKNIPEEFMPKNVQSFIIDRKNNLRHTGSPGINVIEAERVIAEITDKKWWQKLWASIPQFGTIFNAIVKVGCLIASFGMVIRLCGYLYSATSDVKTELDISREANEKARHTLNKTRAEIKEWNNPIEKKEGQAIKYTEGSRIKMSKAVAARNVRGQSYESEMTINYKISRNTFWLICEIGEVNNRRTRTFRCLGLNKNYFIVLDHYIFSVVNEINPKLYYAKQGQFVEVEMDILNGKQLVDSALVICKLPAHIPYFCNIIKFIVKSNSTTNIPPQADLYEYVMDKERDEFKMNVHSFDRIVRKNRVDVQNDDDSGTVVNNIYVYPKGARGLCGSILVSRSNMNRPILGIHVAGLRDNSEGYAEALVFETFEHLLRDGPYVDEERPIGNMESVDNAIMMLNGNVEVIGCVPRKMAMYPPKESRLVKSECAGLFNDVTYDLPVLTSADERIRDEPFSPLREGCYHHTLTISPFNSNEVELVCDDIKQNLLVYAKPQRMEVSKLTYEQAIVGVIDNSHYTSLPMDTSEGFPWIQNRPNGCTNKSWLFEFEMVGGEKNLININSQLLDIMSERDRDRQNNKIQPILFVDCLKDAKLPKEKVLIPGKTRVFSISPVDFTIQVRQYFMDFIVAFRCGRFETETAIGMDFMGMEADKLANYLLQYGNNIVTADYSKFGDTLSPQCVHGVFKIINEWYKFNNERNCNINSIVRSVMCYEVANAQHLMLNLIYKCFGGMPSGNPITVEINSIVNSMYIRLMWLDIMKNNAMFKSANMCSFNNNVRMVTYGDDLIMSVKSDVIQYFNLNTLTDQFNKYGIKFTNSLKTLDSLPYNSILNPATTFLKCTFSKHEYTNLWIMQMERRVVEETCNWRDRKYKDAIGATLEVCHGAMELMYTHGNLYYSKNREKMIDFWTKRGVLIKIPTWNDIDIRVYN